MPSRPPLAGQSVLLAGLDPRLGGGVPAMMAATARNLKALGASVAFVHLSQAAHSGVPITAFEWEGTQSYAVGYRRTGNMFVDYLSPARHARELVRQFDRRFVLGVSQPGLFFRPDDLPFRAWLATTIADEYRVRSWRQEFRDRQWGLLTNHLTLPVSRTFERNVLRRSERVYALSGTTQTVLRSEYPFTRAGWLPFPIDTQRFSPGSPTSSRIVLYVGRVDDNRKNVPLLLRAFRRVLENIPDAQLQLVGEYSKDGRAAQVARALNLGSAVRFLGQQPDATLPDFYRRATVLALSSRQEGLGIVALEAMCSGTPVVSTLCGGPEEDIRKSGAGLLVPSDDAEALSAALITILSDTDLRKSMSDRAAEFGRTVHSDTAFQAALLADSP